MTYSQQRWTTKAVTRILGTILSLVTVPATMAHAAGAAETHRLITATAVAQRCLGFRPTALDEIKLSRAVKADLAAPVSALSINSAIKSLNRTLGAPCGSAEAAEGELIFKDEVLPLLRDAGIYGRPKNFTTEGDS